MGSPEQEKPIRRAWVSRSQALGAIIMAVALVGGLSFILVRQYRAGSGVEIIQAAESGKLYRVDLNRADAPELMLLPGIGEVRAQKIVAARQEKGPFESFEAFREAAGLSQSQVDEISRLAVLGAPGAPAGH